jgi:hypothetical protein
MLGVPDPSVRALRCHAAPFALKAERGAAHRYPQQPNCWTFDRPGNAGEQLLRKKPK